jgi:hypothetical protein
VTEPKGFLTRLQPDCSCAWQARTLAQRRPASTDDWCAQSVNGRRSRRRASLLDSGRISVFGRHTRLWHADRHGHTDLATLRRDSAAPSSRAAARADYLLVAFVAPEPDDFAEWDWRGLDGEPYGSVLYGEKSDDDAQTADVRG